MFQKMYTWNKSATFSSNLKSPLFTWKNSPSGSTFPQQPPRFSRRKKNEELGKPKDFSAPSFLGSIFFTSKTATEISTQNPPLFFGSVSFVKVHHLNLLPQLIASMNSWCYSDPYNELGFGGEKIMVDPPNLPSPTYYGTHVPWPCLCWQAAPNVAKRRGVKGVPILCNIQDLLEGLVLKLAVHPISQSWWGWFFNQLWRMFFGWILVVWLRIHDERDHT